MTEEKELTELTKDELIEKVKSLKKSYTDIAKENFSLQYFVNQNVSFLKTFMEHTKLKVPLPFTLIENPEFKNN